MFNWCFLLKKKHCLIRVNGSDHIKQKEKYSIKELNQYCIDLRGKSCSLSAKLKQLWRIFEMIRKTFSIQDAEFE